MGSSMASTALGGHGYPAGGRAGLLSWKVVFTADAYAPCPGRGKLSAGMTRFAIAALIVFGACRGLAEGTDAGANADAGPGVAGTSDGGADAFVCLGAAGADPEAGVLSQVAYGGLVCTCGAFVRTGTCTCGVDRYAGFLSCPCCPSEEEAQRLCKGVGSGGGSGSGSGSGGSSSGAGSDAGSTDGGASDATAG